MGTKVEYAISFQATSQNSSSSISVHYLDDQPYLPTRELNLNRNLQISRSSQNLAPMDRMPDVYSPDFIKKTMQMHEDVFKQQVRELHRLYSVQKMLMNELKREIKETRQYWNHPTTNSDINRAPMINPPDAATQTASGFGNFQSLRDHPSPKERSGSCSGETVRVTRGFDLEMPAEEGILTRVRAMDDNQAGSSSVIPHKSNKLSMEESDEDSQVELTLSIGGSTGKKKSRNCQSLELDSQASFKSERAEDCSTPTTPMSSSSATFDQERKRPHWLFQGLSINRT